MRVFVAGATGALGRALVPQLAARGHHLAGVSMQDLARPVAAGALDPVAAGRPGDGVAEPEVIVHKITALSAPMSMRRARRPDRFLRCR